MKIKENQIIEFKQNWRDEYLQYVSGFANAQGGTIFIGVDDNGIVTGINNARKLLEDIPNKVRDTMGLLVNVNLMSENGLEYLRIEIPTCSMPVTYRGKYYFRSGSTLQELGGVALNDFLLQKMNLSWDSTPVPTATLDDLDRSAIDYFLRCATDSRRLNIDALHDSTEQVIKNLGLVNDQGRLTMAAMLLFGKDILRWCISAQFRIGRFGTDVSDLITQDNIACPLVFMPDRIIEVLRSKYLITPIHYEGLLRKEPLELPEDGLREILCNAIVHRNYMGGDTQMKVFNDHITLWNDGTLPTNFTIETLMEAHESHPRNRLIAKVFYLAGFIETWGRGYEKIVNSFTKENLQVPVFSEARGGISATILRERFMEQEIRNNSTKKLVGENVIENQDTTQKTSQKTSQKIVELIQNNNEISTQEMANIIGIDRRNIARQIKNLQAKGIIRRVGPDKGGHWEVIDNREK